MKLLLLLAQAFWVLPINLVGLLGFIGSKPIRSTKYGKAYVGGPLAQWFFKKSNMGAITLGWFVFCFRAEFFDEDVETHEAHHQKQQLQQGPFFPLGYYGVMVLLLVLGLDPYRQNPYEIAARHAAGEE